MPASPTSPLRDKSVTIRMSPAEFRRLIALAKRDEVSVSVALRMLVKRAFDALTT